MRYIYTTIFILLIFAASALGVNYLTGSGAKLSDIPVDSDFTSNGYMKRTALGVYGIDAGTGGGGDGFTEDCTVETFTGADTTPDISNGTSDIVRCWVTNGTATITDFDIGVDALPVLSLSLIHI